MSTTTHSTRSWDAELIDLRDTILADAAANGQRITVQEAAKLAVGSIGMMADYAQQWDLDANAAMAAAYQPPTPPPATPATAAARKAALYDAEGVQAKRFGYGYLVPSASRNVVHYVPDTGRCTCEAAKAGRDCWHVALVALQSDTRRAA